MIILAIVLLVLFGAIALFNVELILINLYFTALTLPLWLALTISLLIGMAIAGLFASANGARNRVKMKNKEEELRHAKEEQEKAIERERKTSEVQLELQKRESEIELLNSQLASQKMAEEEMEEKIIREEKIEESGPTIVSYHPIDSKENVDDLENDETIR